MEKTCIIWTEKTQVIDRGGKRIRLYLRKNPGPSKLVRATMRMKGLAWCRMCQDWVLLSNYRCGLCKVHLNLLAKESYKENPDKFREKVYARKRNLIPLPPFFRKFLFDTEGDLCLYCGQPATSIDHFLPVKKGGNNTTDNLLPCCKSCNPKKKDKLPSQFDFTVTSEIIDIISPTATRTGKVYLII